MVDWDAHVRAAEQGLARDREETSHVGDVMFSPHDADLHLGNYTTEQDLDCTVMMGIAHAETLFGVLISWLEPKTIADLLRWNRDTAYDPELMWAPGNKGDRDEVKTWYGRVSVVSVARKLLTLGYTQDGYYVEMTLTPYDMIDLMEYIGGQHLITKAVDE